MTSRGFAYFYNGREERRRKRFLAKRGDLGARMMFVCEKEKVDPYDLLKISDRRDPAKISFERFTRRLGRK